MTLTQPENGSAAHPQLTFFLDANILIAEYNLNTSTFKAFTKFCEVNKHLLRQPYIAYKEAERKYFERILKFNNDIDNLVCLNYSSPIQDNSFATTVIDVDQHVNKYAHNLIGYGRQFDAHLIYNLPEHKDKAIERVLMGLPPIKKDHTNARDALIWFNIIDYIRNNDGHFIFISNDGDFSERNQSILNSYLKTEKDRALRSGSKFDFYKDLSSFLVTVSRDLEPNAVKLAEAQVALAVQLASLPEARAAVETVNDNRYRLHYQLRMAYNANMRGTELSPDVESSPEVLAARVAILAGEAALADEDHITRTNLSRIDLEIQRLRDEISILEASFEQSSIGFSE